MRKRDVLRKTRNMWRWLAENPTKDKYDYFDIYYITDIPMSGCYACESCAMECEKCILLPLWGYEKFTSCPCEMSNSPYKKWIMNYKDRKKNATIIADYCDNELKKIERKSK